MFGTAAARPVAAAAATWRQAIPSASKISSSSPPSLRRSVARTNPASSSSSSSSSMLQRTFSTTPNKATTTSPSAVKPLILDKDDGFGFARHNPLPEKPRSRAVTEIRGPYYSAMGTRYLSDVLETMGHYVDGLKFAGGSFSLIPRDRLREMLDLAHDHGVYVSTGGWAEHLLTHPDAPTVMDRYLRTCKDLGFDVIELSAGFLSLPPDDWLRLVDRVHAHGIKAKPELGIQFGAGGDTDASDLESIGASDPSKLVNMAKRFVAAGVDRMMIESEGVTENVKTWRTDVVAAIMRDIPPERLMFEAADPAVFNWYVREFGVDVNVFVDHSQIVQLSCLRHGIWGKSDTFGKIVSFRE